MASPLSKFSGARWLIAAILVLVIFSALWIFSHRERKDTSRVEAAAPQPNAAPAGSSGPNATPPPSAAAAVKPVVNYPDFQLRPLAVARESATNQWTAEDGRLPEVISKLAHNEKEEERMLAENSRIKRRQLVYRKDTAAAAVQRALLTGEPVKTLILPGLDGQELQFEITSSNLEPSGQIGSFTGHLAGQSQSVVSLAFKFGREAFTVLSPQDGVNFDAEPREPGQVIVKSIDPDTYVPWPGGEPETAASPAPKNP